MISKTTLSLPYYVLRLADSLLNRQTPEIAELPGYLLFTYLVYIHNFSLCISVKAADMTQMLL